MTVKKDAGILKRKCNLYKPLRIVFLPKQPLSLLRPATGVLVHVGASKTLVFPTQFQELPGLVGIPDIDPVQIWKTRHASGKAVRRLAENYLSLNFTIAFP